LETAEILAPVKLGIRVLVVEDEPAISQVCQRSLSREGYTVTVVGDGQAAQTRLSAESFDICLIDIRTPRMSGEELYEWITATKPELIPGIILTTGDVISGDTARFLAAADRPNLPKPFAPTELLAIVKTVAAGLKNGTSQA